MISAGHKSICKKFLAENVNVTTKYKQDLILKFSWRMKTIQKIATNFSVLSPNFSLKVEKKATSLEPQLCHKDIDNSAQFER